MQAAKEGNIPPDEKNAMVSKILNSPPSSFDKIMSTEGVVFLLWRCLRKNHPDVTLEQVGNMIDLNNVEEVGTVIASFMMDTDASNEGVNEEGNASPNPHKNPKKTAKRRR